MLSSELSLCIGQSKKTDQILVEAGEPHDERLTSPLGSRSINVDVKA